MSGPIGRKNLGGGYLDAEDLPPASPLSGDEYLFGIQGGIPKHFTPELLNPSAIIQAQGYKRQWQQSFTNLTHTPQLFSAADQGMFGIEPVICHLGNGGTVTQPAYLSWPFRRGIAQCAISSNIASYAGISSSVFPFALSASTTSFYFGAVVGLPTAPAGPTSQQRFVVGITPAPANGLPAQGLYFLGSTFDPNWRAFSKSAGAEVLTNTGIAIPTVNAFTAHWTTFEIFSEADETDTHFFIDGLEVATHTKGAHFPDYTAAFAGAYCFQGGYNVASSLLVDALHVKLHVPDPGVYGLGTELL